MKIKFAVTICSLTTLLVVNPAFALRPSLTPKAMDVRTEAIKLLEKRDYSRLEELLKLNLKNGDRVDDGQWKLHIAMDGIDGNAAQFLGDAATVEKVFALVSDWTAKYPESKMAKIALANAWISRAWLYRGAKYTSETTPQQFTSFEKGLEKAYSVLKEISDIDDPNPELYMVWLTLALGTGFPSEDTDAIYAKAVVQYPDYYYITLQYLVTKFERWNDEPAALQNALKPLVSNSELYARAMWHLFVYDEKKALADANNGKLAQEGFAAIEKKYNSLITTNQIAYLACMHWRDSALFEKASTKIRNNPDPAMWGKRENYDSCVNWSKLGKSEKP